MSNENDTVGYVAEYLQNLRLLNLKVPSKQLDNGQEETGEYSKQIREPQIFKNVYGVEHTPKEKCAQRCVRKKALGEEEFV